MTAAQQITPVPQPENASKLVQAVQKEVNGIISIAEAYQIDSADMAECAAEDMNAWAKKAKEIDAKRLELKRPLTEHIKLLDSMFNAPIEQLNNGVKTLKAKLLAWHQKEADRIAEEKRKAEAERQRQEAELRAQQAAIEEERQAAIETGDFSKAEDLEEQAMMTESAAAAVVFAPPVQVAAPKPAGASVRDNWKAEVTDKMALIKAIAEGRASPDLLEPCTKVINQRAKALKSEFVVDGIRVFNDQIIAATGRK